MEINVKNKKDLKNKKDIGGNKIFGRDLDPKKELKLVENNERGQAEAYYKGERIKYIDYFGECLNRYDKSEKQFKNTLKTNNLSFSGFGKGTLKKAYKDN